MPIFKRTFSQELDLLEQHLTKDILSQTDCKSILTKLRTTFENAFNSEFKERMKKYTRFNAQSFQDAMICNMDSIGKYMLEIILYQQRTPQLLKQKKLMQTQEDHSNPIQALNVDSLKVDLVVIQNTCSKKEDSSSETASSKSVKESSLDYATKDSKIDTSKAIDANLVVTKRSGTKSEVQDDSTRSGNDTNADDVDIRPIYDEEPMAEVQLTIECNIFAIGKQHTEQPEIINEGRVDQNQSVVRQPNAFKSERPKISKPRFASQVGVKKDFPKPITQHYLTKGKESALSKPHHMIASSPYGNSSKNMPRLSSNDMMSKHADGRKPKTKELESIQLGIGLHLRVVACTANCCWPKQITLGILEVNSHAKVQSNKTRNNNKPVEQKSHTQKPGRQIFTGHRLSPNKTFVVYEKTSPRSDLRWKPYG
ncbi:hypothetical protein Tco_0888955 [Tanacetum coccineum]